ncbi:MAG: hypothetical protein QP766_06100 [Peptoniphilus lacrimalis]|nr:hypothetical protein [Peptoniphilus lacrimalis]
MIFLFPFNTMLSPTFFSVPSTCHTLNSLPAGGVNPHAGNLYDSSLFLVTSAMVPVPPFLSNVILTVSRVGGSGAFLCT